MYLLITNDDGIDSPGLHALAKELAKDNDVIVVAPDSQRSACSHSITLEKQLVVKKHNLGSDINIKAYSVSGTPADCVRIGIDKLADREIDMVISGINTGFNLGMDILYSGTVSAAVEASINKIPAIAVSTDRLRKIQDFETAAQYAGSIFKSAVSNHLDNEVVLNINVPNIHKSEIKGIKVCRIGNMMYGNYFVEDENRSEHRTFDIMGNISEPQHNDTDRYFLEEGYVTLTPLHYDLTNFKLMSEVDSWFNK